MKKDTSYNSWPLGKLPHEKQRDELDKLHSLGYQFDDPREVNNIFEKKIAEFSGSKFAVLVDCCTNGLFLCLKYLQSINEICENSTVRIPAHTYGSVPMVINQSGMIPIFEDVEWSGIYQLGDTRIWDGAVRWTERMYVGGNALQVCSFQLKKRIPIGKGGVIITDDEKAVKWLKLASYDGRDLDTPYDDPNHFKMIGYHHYMTPEDAARGIILMDSTPRINDDSGTNLNYPDLCSYNLFKRN
jgi:dTDP-4-amino-4,6-dideoxygalactose transaminase